MKSQIATSNLAIPPERIERRILFGASSLRSQFVTSKDGRGGRRYSPLAFTEQGVAMLSSVLRSARAVQVNIAIMPSPYTVILSGAKDLCFSPRADSAKHLP